MKKVSLPLTLCFVLAASIFTAAQQPAQQQTQPPKQSADSDVPDRADVLKLLELTRAKEQMRVALDGMIKQMRLGAEQGLKEKVPNATPEQLAKLDDLIESMFSGFELDQFVDAIVPIYQKHLTKTDLTALTAFYESPVGQKVLKELPAISAESIEAGGAVGRKMVADKSNEIDKKIAELINESKQQ
jgi:hypothetical protein